MDLLNLTGPQFLSLYLLLLACAVALTAVIRWASRSPSDGPGPETLDLDPYDVAYLAGGELSAVDATIASLVHRDLVKVNPAGRTIDAVGSLSDDLLHPLEQAVAPNTGASEFGRKIATARQAAKPALEAIRLRLTSLGLLMDNEAVWGAQLLRTIPILAVLLLGLAKIQVGISRDKPVSFLVALCLATTLIEIGFLCVRPHRSRWGDHVLQQLRNQNAALQSTGSRRAADLVGPDLTLAVALFGTGILAGGPLNDLRIALTPPPSVGGGDGGSGDFGGGGGCGGGGCGGCGGAS
ncbi:TIGR04222 domain-containing membrane protein [Singulisphaera sp. Ch08]|uniref:TIGR04222 domain-containing membrane protein n=1 Tax=Singulisphaera sp. Ch08 TaxID=3120278 RepID=A0AAU7C6H5_9BACT